MTRVSPALKAGVNPPVDWRQFSQLRWILTTLMIVVAAGVMVRLGFWQLDRLQQRREHNTRLIQGMALPPLNLNQALPPDLPAMEFRSATASGQYDFPNEVVLRNQYQDGQPGYHLLTPLLIAGSSQAILVDRGWIPLEQGRPELRKTFSERGTVMVSGMLRRSQPEPVFGAIPDPQLAPGQSHLDSWSFINLERISAQISHPILPIYLIAAPVDGQSGLPRRSLPEVDLSEGPHLGYALQWFIFAAILLMGYPFYVRKQLRNQSSKR